MGPARSLEAVLIVACVVLVALVAFVCALDQDGDRAVAVRTNTPSDSSTQSPAPSAC